MQKSRSEMYACALREYLARNALENETDAINRTMDEVGDAVDEFVSAAARLILERTEC